MVSLTQQFCYILNTNVLNQVWLTEMAEFALRAFQTHKLQSNKKDSQLHLGTAALALLLLEAAEASLQLALA